VRIEIPVSIPEKNLIKAINSHLPLDIRVVDAERVEGEFHPIYSAKSKEYNYFFSNKQTLSPFAHEYITLFPFDLDIEAMRKGCELFCGEYDFINFQCTGTEIRNTVRRIFSCELIHFEPGAESGLWGKMESDYYLLKVVGEGFLKQMVRLMMGALISLGRGKISLKDLLDALHPESGKRNERRLGATAPPQGLYLKKVHYD
jgi:tRNA pseudouridine38-40 synthase